MEIAKEQLNKESEAFAAAYTLIVDAAAKLNEARTRVLLSQMVAFNGAIDRVDELYWHIDGEVKEMLANVGDLIKGRQNVELGMYQQAERIERIKTTLTTPKREKLKENRRKRRNRR